MISLLHLIIIAAAATATGWVPNPADAQGGKFHGDWVKRTAVKPDPSKVVVPPGYKVGVFKAGLDTPASADRRQGRQSLGDDFRRAARQPGGGSV